MRDNETAVEARHAECKVSPLLYRMARVRKGQGERVTEDRSRFMESNAMLPGVRAGLLVVPLEDH